MSMNVGAVSQSLGAMAARFNPASAASKPSGPLAGRVTNGHRTPLRMVGLAGLLILGLAAAGCTSPGGSGTARTAGNTASSSPSYSAAANAITPVMGKCVTPGETDDPDTKGPEVGMNESGDLRIALRAANNHVRAHDVNGGVLFTIGPKTGGPTTVCAAERTAEASDNGPARFVLDGHAFTHPVIQLADGGGSFHTGSTAAQDNKLNTLTRFTDGVGVEGGAGDDTINGSGLTTSFFANGRDGSDELTGGGYPPDPSVTQPGQPPKSDAEVLAGNIPERDDVLIGDESFPEGGGTQAPDKIFYRLDLGGPDSPPEDSVTDLTIGTGDTPQRIQ